VANKPETLPFVAENEVIGSLWLGDQLYNALHGVGDISWQHKIAVVTIMHDYYCPDKKLVPASAESQEAFRAGRDDIIGIVKACLASVPQIADPILGQWADQIKAEYQQRCAEADAYLRGRRLHGHPRHQRGLATNEHESTRKLLCVLCALCGQ
jgi:hypothetical protein